LIIDLLIDRGYIIKVEVRNMKVYLAGGMKTGWQDEVKRLASGHDYYDPRIDTQQTYYFTMTSQDLEGIDDADMVFAYYEVDNPSGIGLALEIGYALAKGKRIVVIDEHESIHVFLASCCERLFTDFRKAANWLNTK